MWRDCILHLESIHDQNKIRGPRREIERVREKREMEELLTVGGED